MKVYESYAQLVYKFLNTLTAETCGRTGVRVQRQNMVCLEFDNHTEFGWHFQWLRKINHVPEEAQFAADPRYDEEKLFAAAPYLRQWAGPDGKIEHRYAHRAVGQFDAAARLLAEDSHTRRCVIRFGQGGDIWQVNHMPPCPQSLQIATFDGQFTAHLHLRSSDAIVGLPRDIMMFLIIAQAVVRTAGKLNGCEAPRYSLKRFAVSAFDCHLYESYRDRLTKRLFNKHCTRRTDMTGKYTELRFSEDFDLERLRLPYDANMGVSIKTNEQPLSLRDAVPTSGVAARG